MGLPAATLVLVLAQAPSLEHAQRLMGAVLARDAAVLSEWAGAGLSRQFPTPRALEQFLAKATENFGPELRLIDEVLRPAPDGARYVRRAHVKHWARGVEWELALDGQGRLHAIAARPASTAAPSPHARAVPQTALHLPVSGAWTVLWGGRSFEDNRHAAVPDMRYALDLWMVERGSTFTGDGTRNEQYHCWGKPVLAPASGEVVAVVDGVADNEPNRIHSFESLYGNVVVIRHGPSEYSLLAHLMRDSVVVQPGQRVSAFDPIGRTGNSGLSTEPHVHFHLMDGADWRSAHGLPLVLRDFVRNGQAEGRGEPRRGDVVKSAKFAPATLEF